ncbi:MAG: RnfH family protein, partial [Proteobacteria bacterium]|nr:RnfH family protein [Pseudomonadota bacterium]
FSFEQQKVGIFGKVKPLDTVLAAGDRVELYHPVTIDPKAIPKKKPAAKDAAGE